MTCWVAGRIALARPAVKEVPMATAGITTPRGVARCGLCCALLVCSAWVTVPIGPIPVTLQTLVLALLPQVLPRREAVLTVAVYVLIGIAGLPVFSGFGSGIGALLGPTGGFIWGFVVGMVPAAAVMQAERLPRSARVPLGAAILLAVCYLLGTVQLMAVSGMGVVPALAGAVLPFIIPDVLKVAASMVLSRAISRAAGAATGA